MTNTEDDIAAIVCASFKCYPDKDRARIETLISDDFHFTSPLDNRIDRKTYFGRCWPNSEKTAAIDIKCVAVSGEKAFATYEGLMNDGKRFRNTELFTVRNGRITDVEVYFGWSIPHGAPVGEFLPAKDENKS